MQPFHFQWKYLYINVTIIKEVISIESYGSLNILNRDIGVVFVVSKPCIETASFVWQSNLCGTVIHNLD